MNVFQHKNTDPFFNLAMEEYLMRHTTDDFFILWRNKKAIVLGKHQNALAEVNIHYAHDKNVPILRRLSGGGTVFHDEGNFNFTFILNGQKEKLINFRKYTAPIRDYLQSIGVDAQFSPRNDLFVGDKKISGNAEHIYKNRVLHHGTLLFSSDLKELSEGLHSNKHAYKDKSVQSVRKPVANIADYLKNPLSIEQFEDDLFQFVAKTFDNSQTFELEAVDKEKIQALRDEKYAKWDWNFGYSPKYTFENAHENSKVELHIQKGIIEKVSVKIHQFTKEQNSLVENLLEGKRHDIDEIEQITGNSEYSAVFALFNWKKLLF